MDQQSHNPEFDVVGFDLARFIADTLAEDLGTKGDITSAAVIPADARFTGVMDSRDAIVAAGLPIAEAFFRRLDPEVRIERLVEEGTSVPAGTDLLRLEGKARAMLTAERSALNTVQHLSGIATLTRVYVDAVAGTKARIADTRKTTPGLRALEKQAVLCGGGVNHRFGLDDAILIKDNHVAVCGGVGEAIRRARAAVGHLMKVEVEVDGLDQLDEALAAAPDVIMLDNFTLPMLRDAVARTAGRVTLEASGGVNLETVRGIAETGVDVISVGALTHSAPALDVGLDVIAG